MKQLVLPIEAQIDINEKEFFITKCNEEAYYFLMLECEKIPYLQRILLIGESFSGKTCLAKIWLSKADSLYINCKSDYLDINIDLQYDRVVIDNTEFADEISLLHIINKCITTNALLLLITSDIKKFYLPDLKSRINSAFTIKILPPDNDIILLLIQKICYSHKIKIHPKVQQYIKYNITFVSFQKLFEFQLKIKDMMRNNKILNIENIKICL